jgi:hypothetical protein
MPSVSDREVVFEPVSRTSRPFCDPNVLTVRRGFSR